MLRRRRGRARRRARGRAARAGAAELRSASSSTSSRDGAHRRAALRAPRVRLDPTLPPGSTATSSAARELAQGRRAAARRPLAGAAARARRRAPRRSRAGAAVHDGLTLSLCMIVKDEEEMLPALSRRRGARTSTRSWSSTPARPTARSRSPSRSARSVVDFPWNGSFADARNVSLERATGDWII